MSSDSAFRATELSPSKTDLPTTSSRSHTSYNSESRLIHPRREMDESDNFGQSPSKNAFGQFSFSPATRTTVVTTTTTTTTSFPPLIIRPPRAAKDLDARLYPLATAPTPPSLRNLTFKVGDKSIVFNEPDDSASMALEMKETHDALRSSNGLIRSISSYASQDSKNPRLAPSAPNVPNYSSIKRPVSPLSIPDARPIILPRTRTSRVPSEPIGRRIRHDASTLTHLSTAGLATPETEFNTGSLGEPTVPRQRINSATIPRREALLRSPLTYEHVASVNSSSSASLLSHESQGMNSVANGSPAPEASTSRSVSFSTAGLSSQSRPDLTSQLSAIENAIAQDMCLPSPSLSPVTAMNALNAESSFDSGNDTDSSLDHNVPRHPRANRFRTTDHRMTSHPTSTAESTSATSSLMDMPKVLEFFDSVPEEMKTYMMYQFLRRCPKPTLHFVADVVNPTLKCDFLSLLPIELSLNIVRFLDVQAMCRASQVSKKWRHIINSDEKTWKDLLDKDGYSLSDVELERAITEGWGWQGSIVDNVEKDVRRHSIYYPKDSELKEHEFSSVSCPTPSGAIEGYSLSLNRRPKRKAGHTRIFSRKLAKRKVSTCGTDVDPDWKKEASASEAPYAAANAAARAVPVPTIGIPTLSGLYLYKALYRRHHAIRRAWMNPEAKPKHIAFRAHGRHVVTCLQFDSDKILTGSDDTNIHVYDTKTGALKTTLKGHDGGVWALEYYGNTLVSGSTDRSVRVWDIEGARCTQIFHGHTSTVRCLQIMLPTEVGRDANGRPEMMPKEPLIITGSRDSNLRVWKLPKPSDPTYYPSGPHADDVDCPYFVRMLSGHTHSVRAIAAHGDTLVSGSYDTTVRVWKVSTGQILHTLTGHTLKVYSVVLDTKRNRCISGAMDHMVKVWSLDDGSLLYNLEGHTSLVGLLSLQNDQLVSAAADSTLRIWDPAHGHCKNMLSAHTGAITCFQHDGQKVISGSDRTLKMWDVNNGACVRDLLTDLSGVWQVKFNDRRCVAAVQRDNFTYIEVLDFGASRDGVPDYVLGNRVTVNEHGEEIQAPSADTDSDSD